MIHLVLGSEGQIGKPLVEHLKKMGLQPIGYDLAASPEEDLRIMSPRLEELIEQADFVYFLAFDVGGSHYLEKYQNTFDFMHNNCRVMVNTFSILERTKTPFIFASSQMSNMSHSDYGLLKLIGERYSQRLGGITVKFWNVYGVENDPEKTHVITDFINMSHNNRQISMRTNGAEERQFLHADDCSACLTTIAEQYDTIPRDEELHVTSFEWTSILDVAELVAKRFYNTKIMPSSKVDNVQQGVRNEPSKAICKYWQPKLDLETGINKVIKDMNLG